ncbi:N-acetyltransferase family protein [Pseudomonas segetis]|uniref:L-methionine sulfoximine/L-methionine sulfone acetyltransferase n=1 Tax=Pseudomonas segetis TaxID=298908 RepID=A0A239DG77_9PSED|nr:GNAT family N-acetyltransferase [Pseudomonas segetis]SNS31370.1 phosphinothricin acetyltransferase [Pseudomonas segetis]
MNIDNATEQDLPELLAIYNDAVLNSTAIWNETMVDLENRRLWLRERLAAGFPVLAARNSTGRLVGYATYGTWRSIEGFKHTVEHSVYVCADQRGLGIGPALMKALIERARSANLHVMVAAIESENRASIRLHKQLGFITTGQMPQVGRKFDRWLDLTFMQLNLNADEQDDDKE